MDTIHWSRTLIDERRSELFAVRGTESGIERSRNVRNLDDGDASIWDSKSKSERVMITPFGKGRHCHSD